MLRLEGIYTKAKRSRSWERVNYPDVFAHLSEDDMLAVQPGGHHGAQEELRSNARGRKRGGV